MYLGFRRYKPITLRRSELAKLDTQINGPERTGEAVYRLAADPDSTGPFRSTCHVVWKGESDA